MKRVMVGSLVLLFFVLSVSFVLGGDPSSFIGNCASSGCYLYDCDAPDGPPIDIIGELENCSRSLYCENNSIKETYTSQTYSGPSTGPYAECVSNIIPSCTYDIEDCTAAGVGGICLSEDPPRCCVPKTCADIAQEIPIQCGVNLSDGCAGTVDCLSMPNAVCNTTTNLYVCGDGYSNCDGDWSNGCEYDNSDFQTDSNNCGACNNACGIGLPCRGGVCIGNEWRDMNNVVISQAYVGDFVRLVSPFAGTSPVYLIMDGGSVIGDDHLVNYLELTDVSSVGYAYNVSNSVVENDLSAFLTMTEDEEGDDDDDFVLDIIEPICGEYFDVGTMKLIKINASDSDDLITGSLSINDVLVLEFDNSNGNIIEFNYSFDEVGTSQIVVFANNSDGKEQKIITNVMVYDSSNLSSQFYVAACIDYPQNFERFDNYAVNFTAASSTAIKYNGTVNLISRDLLHFDWKFWLSTNKWGQPCAALGDSHCVNSTGESVWSFVRRFPTVNDNEVHLIVSIPDDVVLSF